MIEFSFKHIVELNLSNNRVKSKNFAIKPIMANLTKKSSYFGLKRAENTSFLLFFLNEFFLNAFFPCTFFPKSRNLSPDLSLTGLGAEYKQPTVKPIRFC